MIIKCKNFFKVILFFVILCLIFGCISLFLKPKANTRSAGFYHPSAYSICNEPNNTIDLLILGTSEAYCSFIPLELWEDTGIPAYLCSTPNQPLYYAEAFLHKTFETQTPSIVVIETDTIFQEFDEIDILDYKIDETFIVKKYHGRWKKMKKRDFFFHNDYSQRHYDKGFMYDFDQQVVPQINHMIPTEEVEPIPEINLYYLDRIVKYCEEKGVKIVFVSAISTAYWNYSKHNAIIALADQYDIEYIDANFYVSELNLDWDADWQDNGKHLNYYGALKFTKWFEQYLLKYGELNDKRGNPDYAFWDLDIKQAEFDIPQLSN